MSLLIAGLAFTSNGTRADDPPKSWEFVGRTQATTIDVRARVTGYLTRVAVREGDAVAKGDLLVEIDPRAYQLDLNEAKARLKVAEAGFQAARIKANQVKSLSQGSRPVVSSIEVALAEAKAAEPEAAVMVAKVGVERAELALSWTKLAAPFNGRVGRIQAIEGGLATANQTHILTVVATDPMYVTFNVPEAVLLRLRRDGLAEPDKLDVAVGFAIDKGFPHAAKLDRIDSQVNPQTGNVQFRAKLPNPKGLLLPGMSARVRLTPQPK
jgi:RND family efflux transporter MFP subunit